MEVTKQEQEELLRWLFGNNINIKQEEDLYEKYSNNVSRDLINYLIRETKYVNDDIKIMLIILDWNILKVVIEILYNS